MVFRRVVAILALCIVSSSSFCPPLYNKLHASCRLAGKGDSSEEDNPLLKASWYAVETFGKVFGSARKQDETASATLSMDAPPASMDETLQRIQADNQREYFLSGQVDELIYDENCVFADPFVSFKGRRRFVENLANLGSFITEYSAKPLDYKVLSSASDNVVVSVETKFMVKLQLNLPWKPVLAWPWGVVCTLDPVSNQIVSHVEKWDVSAGDGVKQLFRKPTTTVKK
jgi:hypothetical protein